MDKWFPPSTFGALKSKERELKDEAKRKELKASADLLIDQHEAAAAAAEQMNKDHSKHVLKDDRGMAHIIPERLAIRHDPASWGTIGSVMGSSVMGGGLSQAEVLAIYAQRKQRQGPVFKTGEPKKAAPVEDKPPKRLGTGRFEYTAGIVYSPTGEIWANLPSWDGDRSKDGQLLIDLLNYNLELEETEE